jgi:hypothetical protein
MNQEKECAEKRKEYRKIWGAAHKEEQIEYGRKYYAAHREERVEYARKRRVENPEKIKEACRKYRERHPEHQREWAMRRPDYAKALRTISDHRTKGFIIKISTDHVEKLLKESKYCPQCGNNYLNQRFKTVDRINNSKILAPKTIQIICLRCNVVNAHKMRKQEKQLSESIQGIV